MLRTLLFFVFVSISQSVIAECTFKTGGYIDELSKPENIMGIEINVAKSAKFQRNAYKTILSQTNNIPTNLKKNFKAKITVIYPFGRCEYKGRIRQSGDWRDHIVLSEDGQDILRSLDVKLYNGNILNSVRFKLLLPETRGDLNEIFAVSLLNALQFITPETFRVKVTTNGVVTPMIFQETARKELLERNGRREGPIFEGDETILWGKDRLPNDNVSLVVMENVNWFLKGQNSKHIALKAYTILQAAYILRGNHELKVGHHIDPNSLSTSAHVGDLTFPKFHFIMQALAAEHGLVFHNRKFYYNVFSNSFEPIYYDGNAMSDNSFNDQILTHAYRKLDTAKFLDEIISNETRKKAQKHFTSRSQLPVREATLIFSAFWEMYEKRAMELQRKIDATEITESIPDRLDSKELKMFLRRASANPYIGQLGVELSTAKNSNYLINLRDNQSELLVSDELADILEKNELSGKRFTLLTLAEETGSINHKVKEFLNGHLVSSKGMKISVDYDDRQIVFEQQKSDDWVLIKGVDLNSWNVTFSGSVHQPLSVSNQRFNEYGMTGCLNFYKSKLTNVKLDIEYGICEDSLNIVKSKGSITHLRINHAYSDAIDMDFSSIDIQTTFITNAGNDCVDVSGGNYSLGSLRLEQCGDKAISVGEGSSLIAKTVYIGKAKIGMSSKDLSKALVEVVTFEDVDACIEAKQKKQEFGGAYISLSKSNCTINADLDVNSIFEQKK